MFLRRLSPIRAALILIPQRGGQERVLGETDLLQCCLPGPYLAWTPNSKWLALPRTEVDHGGGLFLFSLETGELRRLTLAAGFGTMNEMAGEAGGDTTPAFSPDGRTLAFTRIRSNKSDVYLLRLAEGYIPQGGPEQVILDNSFNSGLTWTPNGSEILFLFRTWVQRGRNLRTLAEDGL